MPHFEGNRLAWAQTSFQQVAAEEEVCSVYLISSPLILPGLRTETRRMRFLVRTIPPSTLFNLKEQGQKKNLLVMTVTIITETKTWKMLRFLLAKLI
jgi:hypothetical protein